MRSAPRIVMAFPKFRRSMIFHEDEIARLRNAGDLSEEMPDEWDEKQVSEIIRDADAVITSWGTGRLTKEILDSAPNLRIIAHAAGTVKGIVTEAVWERGIIVTNSAEANAISVAQYTFALMIMMLKEVPFYMMNTRHGGWRGEEDTEEHPLSEPYRVTVGVVSASRCGRQFISMLRDMDVRILLYDPMITAQDAQKLGSEKVALDDLMANSDIVSLHAPSIPATHHMIYRGNLRLLRDGALILQTSRGSVVNEADLVAELKTGRIRAAIDVTDPEPPSENSLLRSLPNVVLTPHLAGAAGKGCWRMGSHTVTEIENALSGKPPVYPVTRDMLEWMA